MIECDRRVNSVDGLNIPGTTAFIITIELGRNPGSHKAQSSAGLRHLWNKTSDEM